MSIRPVRFDPEFFRDLIDYKDGTNEQAKIFSEFLPEIPTPPTPPTPEPDFQYEIGEYVASEGGVIVNRWLSDTAYGAPSRGSFQNYTIVDTIDLNIFGYFTTVWADLDVNISGAESQFDGYSNTSAMIIAGIPAGIGPGTAAVLCNDSTNGGKTDWYLPSVSELLSIWYNYNNVLRGMSLAGGTLFDKKYWTSTESSLGQTQRAFTFSFLNGILASELKTTTTAYVRAFRRFNIQTV